MDNKDEKILTKFKEELINAVETSSLKDKLIQEFEKKTQEPIVKQQKKSQAKRVPEISDFVRDVKPSEIEVRSVEEDESGEKVRENLRNIKTRFSPPRPEFTMFKLGRKRFHPYSTSEAEEESNSSYYVSLASLYSAGENIARTMKDLLTETQLSLEDSEMFSLLPLRKTILYVGKVGPQWLFSIRSEKFPRERLNIPERVNWKTYERENVEIEIDNQLNLMFRGAASQAEYDQTISIFSDLFRVCYQTGVKKLERFQKDNFAILLLQTPNSKLSPFISMRIGKGKKDENIFVQIFPVWLAYDELKLVKAETMVKEAYKNFIIKAT